MECIQWCSYHGNTISQFADDHNIKRTTIYSWKNSFIKSGLDIRSYLAQQEQKDINLPVQRANTECSGFVRVMPQKETETKKQEEGEITIQTNFCILKISSNITQKNLTNILKSV